jgi:uncharacterized protein (TIGR02001 family)
MFKIKIVSIVLVTFAASLTHAQTTPKPDYTLSYDIGAVSDYRFRGIQQTGGAPAVQLGADFGHKNGFYAGIFTSRVTWVRQQNGASSGELEIDYYFGFKSPLVSNVTLDIGFIRYDFPGNDSGIATSGFSNASTNEGYIGLGYGVTNLKFSQSFGDYLGNLNSSGSRYVELSFNVDLGSGFTLLPRFGYQTIPNQTNSNGDFSNYALTLKKDLNKNFSATLTAVGTNANSTFYRANYNGGGGSYLGGNASVLGVKYTF